MVKISQVKMSQRYKVSLGEVTSEKKHDLDKEKTLVEFERYLVYEKRYSKSNVANMMMRARVLLYKYDIGVPCIEDAYAVEEKLRAQGNVGAGIRHYLRCLEVLAEYHGVQLKIRKPKKVKTEVEVLNLVECRALMSACDTLRDKALVTTLLYAGIRNKELLNLDLQDVDLKARILHVRYNDDADIADPSIKTMRERKVAIFQEHAKSLKEWVAARPQVETKALFITSFGARLSKDYLTRTIRELGHAAGIEKRVYPHLLRHTCASLMMSSGFSPVEVAAHLGHRSPYMTLDVYGHASVEDVKAKEFRY